MKLGRREFVVATSAAFTYALFPSPVVLGGTKMYGLIGKAKTVEGKRDEFIKLLLEGTGAMPEASRHPSCDLEGPSYDRRIWGAVHH